MKMKHLLARIVIGTGSFFLLAITQAGIPLWTFSPKTDTQILLPANGTAIIQYIVTNQSKRSHILAMTPIAGIKQVTKGSCQNPFKLDYQKSCRLTLQVSGSALRGNVFGGPTVCEQSNPNNCYQPSFFHVLNITVVPATKAIISVKPTALSFNVGSSGSVTVTNSASSLLTADNIEAQIPGLSNIAVQSSTCPASLPIGANCVITFTSTTVEGPTTIPIRGVNTNQVNVAVTVTPIPDTTLSTSVSTLALSVNDVALNAALTGTSRTLTIANIGMNAATDVTYSPSSALPAGTTITPASCGTIAPGGNCVLTITPGATPSAAPGDTNPTPITLTIEGNNTNTLMPTLNILTYGSVYQSGFVFAVDDTTPNTGSISGKVAALSDQADPFPNGVIWSSDGDSGMAGDVVFNSIYGIDESSTTASPSPLTPPVLAACDGATDGACNTDNIVTYYSPPTTDPAVNLSFYAAGLCEQYAGGGFTDWYLPAICEMGYNTEIINAGCGTQGNPTLQNMQSNLVDNGDIGNLASLHHSSTEYSGAPNFQMWQQTFAPGASDQFADGKGNTFAVRCVRAITN